MVCGVAIGDVNNDELPDIILGQHFSQPWVEPVANRLYLQSKPRPGQALRFMDVTEKAGLTPLPLKGPHVEIQDFDNDGRVDLYTSIVKFSKGKPYPVIFRQQANGDGGIPKFATRALSVNDFPTNEDRALRRSGKFFEKMLRDGKITYSAPGPSGDFNRDGRLDLFLGSWWAEQPSLLLQNETKGGNWLEVRVNGSGKVNRDGIGSRVRVLLPTQGGKPPRLLGNREIAVGFGYASSQEAVAHFGLGQHSHVDVEVVLPHDQGRVVQRNVAANQRLTIESARE